MWSGVSCGRLAGRIARRHVVMQDARRIVCAKQPHRRAPSKSANKAAAPSMTQRMLDWSPPNSGIPFPVCNFKRTLVASSITSLKEYVDGRTPNPCVRCNDWLKFGKPRTNTHVRSAHRLRRIGPLRTRRACRRRTATSAWRRSRQGQVYVLFGVQREQLSHMMLPIGGPRKTRRARDRQAAWPARLRQARQPRNMFVFDNDYAGLVERRVADSSKRGVIVDTAGKVVGEHQGQHQFTIGQRRGLNLALDIASTWSTRTPRPTPSSSAAKTTSRIHTSKWAKQTGS